jgi:hypothetical protein
VSARRIPVPIVLAGFTGLVLHAALLAGMGVGLPVGARVVGAFLALVLTPGLAFVAAGLRAPGGGWFAPGWALGFGIAWNSILVLAAVAFRMPFLGIATGALVVNSVLWAVVLWRARAVGPPPPGDPFALRSRIASAAVILACAFGLVHAARFGTPLGYMSDSPDHVGTVRRMLVSGDPFPTDAFFRDAGESGRDPRKGVWHPQVALVAKLAGADPLDTWVWLSVPLVPLFALNAAALGLLLAGPAGAAIAGWALILTYGGTLAEQYLREAVFATKLGDQLALATAVAVLIDLRRRTRGSRAAAIGLALAAVFTHVYYAMQFAIAFGALGAGMLVRDRGWSSRVRRLTATGLALGLAAVPYLMWRASQSYAPRNVIHTTPQGLMTLWGAVHTMNAGILWDWMGVLWVVIPFAIPFLWREGARSDATLYVATTSIAVASMLFLPPLVALLHPRLGYLILRTVWMIPLPALLAWVFVRLVGAVRAGPGRRRAAIAFAALTVLSLPVLGDAVHVIRDPARYAHEERLQSYWLWQDGLVWMRDSLPPGQVVLSDPLTCYTVPMVTGHYVTTLLDQHSSPNDPRALERIFDARDGLDPHASWEQTRAIVDRYGATVVVLNNRVKIPPMTVYWRPEPGWFDAARARLDRAPDAFIPVFDTGDFVVYRIDPAALARLTGPGFARPFVVPYDPARGTVARRIADDVPALQSANVWPPTVAPGDTLHGVLEWRTIARLPRGSYRVSVRFDRPLPGGLVAPAPVAKPVRKMVEMVNHERYRFRQDHLPVGGAYGVDLWQTDEVVRDSFEIVVPGDVAAGAWQVQARMMAEAPYPNYRLSDYFHDVDYYSGLPIGTIRIGRRGAAAPVPAGAPGGH